MMYKDWLNTITKQINEYGDCKGTDLVVLRNHLEMLLRDVEQDPNFKEQLSKCID